MTSRIFRPLSIAVPGGHRACSRPRRHPTAGGFPGARTRRSAAGTASPGLPAGRCRARVPGMVSDPGFPTLLQTVLDCPDARALAEFYRELFGLRVPPGRRAARAGEPDPQGRDWLVLSDADRTPAGVPAGRRARRADLAARPAPTDAAPRSDRRRRSPNSTGSTTRAAVRRAAAARPLGRPAGAAAGLRRSGRSPVLSLRGAGGGLDPDCSGQTRGEVGVGFQPVQAHHSPPDTSPAASPRTPQRWANSATVSGSGPSTTSAVPNSATPEHHEHRPGEHQQPGRRVGREPLSRTVSYPSVGGASGRHPTYAATGTPVVAEQRAARAAVDRDQFQLAAARPGRRTAADRGRPPPAR